MHVCVCVCVRVCEPDSEEQEAEMRRKFERFQRLAELYHVYHSIQRYTVRPAAQRPRGAPGDKLELHRKEGADFQCEPAE